MLYTNLNKLQKTVRWIERGCVNVKKKLEIQYVILIVTILQIAYALMAFAEASGADGASLAVRRVMHSGGLGLAVVMVAAFIMADGLYNVQKIIKMVAALFIQAVVLVITACIAASAGLNIGGEYIIFVVKVCVIYVLLPEIFGVIAGMAVRQIKNRTAAVVVAITVIYVFTMGLIPSVWNKLSGSIGSNRNLFRLYHIFNITGGLHNIPDDYIYTIPVETPELERIILWITLAFTALMISKIKEKNRYTYTAGLASAVICVISIFLYIRPFSEYVVYRECLYDSWNEQEVYEQDGGNVPYTDGGFNITECSLSITINRQLSACAVISVDNKNLPEYTFYLGKEYGVTGVWDADGKAMPYAVNKNTFTVTSGSEYNISQIKVEYKGGSMYYISNSRAVLLARNHFYPVSGNYGNDETDFNVKVNAGYRIYSNLDNTAGDGKTETNVFSGKSNSLILYGGMGVRETSLLSENSENQAAVKIVYPGILYSEEEIKNIYLEEQKKLEENKIDVTGRDWFAIPFRTIKYNEFRIYNDFFTGSSTDIDAYCEAVSMMGGR